MSSDLQLLQRYAASGDALAFRELVQAHAAMVLATARRVTGDAALAEDVTQETFLELARKAELITRSVAAWLHRVARNRACDVVRRESRRRSLETAMADRWHTERDSAWSEIEPHVDAALDALPADLREVLVLYFLEGRTQAAVAAHLGKDQATVSRAIKRGTELMRTALASRGVMAGSGLAAVLATAPSAQALPGSLETSLGKLALSGVGVSTIVGPPAIAILAMKTSTKLALTTVAILALGIIGVEISSRRHSQQEGSADSNLTTKSRNREALAASAEDANTRNRNRPPTPVNAAEAAKEEVIHWLTSRFGPLFGLSKQELMARLAEMGIPLSDRAVELLLKKSTTAEDFVMNLAGEISLMHPDWMMKNGITDGLSAMASRLLMSEIQQKWAKSRLESWIPDADILSLLVSRWPDDQGIGEMVAVFSSRVTGFDPIQRGKDALALPPGNERLAALADLAGSWPARRAAEMIPWAMQNLQGKELYDFFTNLGAGAYRNGDPDLALSLLQSIADQPMPYCKAAPQIAGLLAQYDRPQEAIQIMESLKGGAQEMTARMIAKHWALRDPEGAINWTNTLADREGLFNDALYGMIEHLPLDYLRPAVEQWAKDEMQPEQEESVMNGLRRMSAYVDAESVSQLLPDYYSQRGYVIQQGEPYPQGSLLDNCIWDSARDTAASKILNESEQAAEQYLSNFKFASPEDRKVLLSHARSKAAQWKN